ncbi:MAG: YciI family protein [Actinomycetota bacterium]
MPKFLLTIYDDESRWATMTPEDGAKAIQAYREYSDEVQASGAFVAGEGLQPTMTAKTVTSEGVTDGPFAETKEQLGGFYLLDCTDEAEAVEWAGKVPSVVHMRGTVEVRPVQEFPTEE